MAWGGLLGWDGMGWNGKEAGWVGDGVFIEVALGDGSVGMVGYFIWVKNNRLVYCLLGLPGRGDIA